MAFNTSPDGAGAARGRMTTAVTAASQGAKSYCWAMTGSGIGASVKRREDLRLLRGRGRYAEDCKAVGQAYAAFVRSPHAHADVVALDAAPARAVDGVLGVFTGRDLVADGVGTIPTLIAERGGGIRNRDGTAFAEPQWFSLAVDRVRHVGEPVAMVVAATAAAARDGAEAVVVRYAPRRAVVDAVTALVEGAPEVHAVAPGNLAYDWECGDPESTGRAIAVAAHVTRLTLVDNRLITCFLEPRAALAEWDAGAGRYTLHAGLQSVHQLATNLARVLGVPAERVRCVTDDVGGGFGSKIQVYPEYVALAWAARHLGRPVKWVSNRSEGFVSDVQSRDHVLSGELALDASGRIIGLRVHSRSNLGAYVAPSIPISTLSNMERMISGLYAIPAIHLRVEGVLTNTVPINVYRGVGRLECVYTVERLVERAARETGRDPTALRRANMVRTFPYRTATGALYDSGDYVARLDEAIERGACAGFRARRAEAARRGRLRGIGLGPYIEGTGGVPQEFAEVRVLPTGIVEVPPGQQLAGPEPRDRLRAGGRRAARRAVRDGARRDGRHRPGGEGRGHVRLALDGPGGQRGGRSLGRGGRGRQDDGGAPARGRCRRRRISRGRVPRRRHRPRDRHLRRRARRGRRHAAAAARLHPRRRQDAREPGVRLRQRLRGV
jgi:carbon-monoxide dehydrogenase large subunit